MASRPKILFLLLVFSALGLTSRTIIDPESCRVPAPQDPNIGLQNVQDVLDEAYDMARAVRDALTQAVGDPDSAARRRVDYILDSMLAAKLDTPYFPRVKGGFPESLRRCGVGPY